MKLSLIVASLMLPSVAIAQSSGSPPPPSDHSHKMVFPYPPEALRACAEGRSIVEILIGADGVPQDVTLIQSSGSDVLDAAAKTGWLKSKWKPATQNGQPVESRKRMATNWSLGGAKCVPGQGLVQPNPPDEKLNQDHEQNQSTPGV